MTTQMIARQTDVEFTTRARAWNGYPIGTYRIRVDLTESARHAAQVWDPIAESYTRCHSLTLSAMRRIYREASRIASEEVQA